MTSEDDDSYGINAVLAVTIDCCCGCFSQKIPKQGVLQQKSLIWGF
jgi:hypothetical protein